MNDCPPRHEREVVMMNTVLQKVRQINPETSNFPVAAMRWSSPRKGRTNFMASPPIRKRGVSRYEVWLATFYRTAAPYTMAYEYQIVIFPLLSEGRNNIKSMNIVKTRTSELIAEGLTYHEAIEFRRNMFAILTA